MATYKVLQDIEAEDKLLGPLTLKQFIYAIIVLITGYVAFQLALVQPLLAVPFLPVIIFFGLLAAPFGKDQSSEVWLLAKIRFFIKPRKRVWDQSGAKQLVTITAPKKEEKNLTKGYTKEEVKSRLEALANTIDSRGWIVKNVSVNMSAQPAYFQNQGDSDRLVDPSAFFPQQVAEDDYVSADMLDEQGNPTAQHLSQLMQTSDQARRKQLLQRLQQQEQQDQSSTQPSDYWFLNQPDASQITEQGYGIFDGSQSVKPQPVNKTAGQSPTEDEEALIQKIKDAQERSEQANSNLRTIKPLSEQAEAEPNQQTQANTQAQAPVTPKADPAILELANNDDLDVATIARQAEKSRKKDPPNDEVVISLH